MLNNLFKVIQLEGELGFKSTESAFKASDLNHCVMPPIVFESPD